jgi:peptidoglycan/xylan/chitin deacetylase (PgdA/CDA1 family)
MRHPVQTVGSGLENERVAEAPDFDWQDHRSLPFKAAMWTASHVAAGMQQVSGNHCAQGFTILMYHRVAERIPGVAAPTCNVSPKNLRRQLAGLLKRGFEAWPLSRLVAAQRESRSIRSNVFAVTFDDGYENNYLHALPILKEFGVPATIFLATKYLDSNRPFPFDNWSAKGSPRVPELSWRPLSTAQCHQLLESGLIELGAHTHTHARFLGRVDEFRRDLAVCLDVLRDRFGINHPTFAFPFGDTSPELVEVARTLDVSCCLTTCRRRIQAGDDVYQWGRFDVTDVETAATLAAKLSGWYTRVALVTKSLARPVAALTRTAEQLHQDPSHQDRYCPIQSAGKALS